MPLNKALLTAAGPNMKPVLDQYSLPAFNAFAGRHGYAVETVHLDDDSAARKTDAAKRARWQKIDIMRQTLQRYDVVAWFDADVMICRTDEDILDSLPNSSYQGLVLHHVPAEDRINPNTGVWVMRQSERSFQFLDAVEAVGMPDGRWSDQGAVLEALGWETGDDRYFGARVPMQGTEFMNGTAWLPVGWNQPYCDNRPNPEAYVGRPTVDEPNAVHFMAMTIADRLKYMGSIPTPAAR